MSIEIVLLEKVSSDDMYRLRLAIATETECMLHTAAELEAEYSAYEGVHKNSILDKNVEVFVAVDGPAPVGYIASSIGRYEKNRHCANLVIGVLKRYHGSGVASRLLERLLVELERRNIKRLELTVVESNERARSFYKKHGLKEEGIRLRALNINGKFCNEIYMSKML